MKPVNEFQDVQPLPPFARALREIQAVWPEPTRPPFETLTRNWIFYNLAPVPEAVLMGLGGKNGAESADS